MSAPLSPGLKHLSGAEKTEKSQRQKANTRAESHQRFTGCCGAGRDNNSMWAGVLSCAFHAALHDAWKV